MRSKFCLNVRESPKTGCVIRQRNIEEPSVFHRATSILIGSMRIPVVRARSSYRALGAARLRPLAQFLTMLTATEYYRKASTESCRRVRCSLRKEEAVLAAWMATNRAASWFFSAGGASSGHCRSPMTLAPRFPVRRSRKLRIIGSAHRPSLTVLVFCNLRAAHVSGILCTYDSRSKSSS